MKEGLLIVVSGPSGVGKGTVCRTLLKEVPQLQVSVSMTTRSPRKGEVEGRSYFFTDRDNFLRLTEESAFLEWAEIYGDFYGTPRSFIENQRKQGKDVILEIDTQGARQVKETYREGVFIFLLPPSFDDLKGRIIKRGTEKAEIMNKRLNFAYEELQNLDIYDYVVLNDRVLKATSNIVSILEAEKLKVKRNEKLIEKVLKEGTS